jgi:hypothetical protein
MQSTLDCLPAFLPLKKTFGCLPLSRLIATLWPVNFQKALARVKPLAADFLAGEQYRAVEQIYAPAFAGINNVEAAAK